METLLSFIVAIANESWQLLKESSIYIIFGLLVGGLLKVFLSPTYVAKHLGKGRFMSVFKAALFGIPIPLCSCGVLPAAASLKKQGANNGATTAFLISTPESGVDSISITWALLDPIMTVARPLSAFITAFVAGISENLIHRPKPPGLIMADTGISDDTCCEDKERPSTLRKITTGMNYAAKEIWGDLAGWFFFGILLAGIISALVPDDMIAHWLGGGISSMLIMLLFGIPLYICATASTPIAAAFILKGVSPGTALVFLLVGPATNITSLSVLIGLLGKRATVLYLLSISIVSVICGLLVDLIYNSLEISAQASVGQAGEIMPEIAELGATFLLIALSIPHLVQWAKKCFRPTDSAGCECSSGSCSTETDKAPPPSTSCSYPDITAPVATLFPMAQSAPAEPGEIIIPAVKQSFTSGSMKTVIGSIPVVTSDLTARDRRGSFLARWNIGRMHFIVEPGLYALGNPDTESPVLVTANYKMSFDVLRSSLPGKNLWLLVLDTKGINVWCAAGKGTFGTEELYDRIRSSGLEKIVSHRRIIVPQLGAPGVDGLAIQKHTGFHVVWGPVSASDIPYFLDNKYQLTAEMRRKLFPFSERLALVPVELVQASRNILPFVLLFFLLSGLGGELSFRQAALEFGPFATLALACSVAAGTIIVPLLLPWIPGRALSTKGFWAGIITAYGLFFFSGRLTPSTGAEWTEMTAWLLIITAVSSWFGMNFTGATTYTSRSGTRKEMFRAIPLQCAAVVIGFSCWLFARFYF